MNFDTDVNVANREAAYQKHALLQSDLVCAWLNLVNTTWCEKQDGPSTAETSGALYT